MNNHSAWGRGVATIGWSSESPNYAMGWCDAVPGTLSGSSVTIRTYIYEIYNVAGEWIGWYPTTASNVNYAYTVIGIPCIPPPPLLSAPANGAINVSLTPTLNWNASTCATSYRLQVSDNYFFSYIVYDYPGLTTTSKQVDVLPAYSRMYYWRVNASNGTSIGNWSNYWSFTTQSAPPDPCSPYSSIVLLDEFTIIDVKGNSRKLYVGNGNRRFALSSSDFDIPSTTSEGILDAKFSSGKFIESIPPGDGSKLLMIKIKDATPPLTLDWEIKDENKITYWISAPGKNDTAIKLSGTGNTVVESSKDGDLIIIAQAIDPCEEQKAAIGGEQLDHLSSAPIEYSLEQNSPNPFNPHTVIEYSLPEAAYVVLKVYNILGEEVKTLVNETQDVGYKSVRFDASSLPSGIYLYKLTAGAFTYVKKMILMK